MGVTATEGHWTFTRVPPTVIGSSLLPPPPVHNYRLFNANSLIFSLFVIFVNVYNVQNLLLLLTLKTEH